jgi:hypothetical protein
VGVGEVLRGFYREKLDAMTCSRSYSSIPCHVGSRGGECKEDPCGTQERIQERYFVCSSSKAASLNRDFMFQFLSHLRA